MENGVFLNLSGYYDTEELAQGLKTDVMDGCLKNGARLVLPLGYNMPVLYVDRESLAAHGLTPEGYHRKSGIIYYVCSMGDYTGKNYPDSAIFSALRNLAAADCPEAQKTLDLAGGQTVLFWSLLAAGVLGGTTALWRSFAVKPRQQ